MDELDEKAIKPLQRSLKEVISRMDDIMDSRDQLLEQVKAIKAEMDTFDQKQNEINSVLQSQNNKQQELLNQLVTGWEAHSSQDRPNLAKDGRDENIVPSPPAGEFDPSTFRFYIDIYPRPDQTYAGRILHPLSKEKASFKGVDGTEIQSFIQKHLPAARVEQSATTGTKGIKLISESAAKQLQQQHNLRTAVPAAAAKPVEPSVWKFKLIQDKQALLKAPYRLQANKAFAVAMELALPVSQQDQVKSNYMVAYQTHIILLSMPQRKQILNSRVNGGMNSKQPRDAKLINLSALARGKYFLEIDIKVPQKQIVEKAQYEIVVD